MRDDIFDAALVPSALCGHGKHTAIDFCAFNAAIVRCGHVVARIRIAYRRKVVLVEGLEYTIKVI